MKNAKSGITLMSLLITVIILIILAGVSIRAITLDNGVFEQAKQVKRDAEIKDLEEQIDLAIIQAEAKNDIVTLDTIIDQLIRNKIISNESQVNRETGVITVGEYQIEGKLKAYLESYYENPDVNQTDIKYFTFALNEQAKTATITGVKEEYGEKYYYNDVAYVGAIKDGETYITDVVIPATITENGVRYTVDKIGASAFYLTLGCSIEEDTLNAYFNSFVLPNTITTIEERAFFNCNQLTNINIPQNVTTIGAVAFSGCTSLRNLTIPNRVNNIGRSAFSGCTNLESINLPKSLTRIEEILFFDCKNLKSLTIPNSVTSIGAGAFKGCTNLQSLIIPASITKIESYAFSRWTAEQTIDCQAFKQAPSGWDSNWSTLCNAKILWNVDPTDAKYFTYALNEETKTAAITGVKDEYATKYYYLGEGSIGAIKDGTNYITDVVIPSSYTDEKGVTYTIDTIKQNAFMSSKQDSNPALAVTEAKAYFTSFVIPGSVKTIEENAFHNCPELQSVTLQAGVTTIGTSVFSYCKKLVNVNLREGLTSIANNAFYNCESLSDITLPNGVKTLGNEVFYGCTSLEKISIPNSVMSIGKEAFKDCSGLANVTLEEGITSIGSQAFYGCTSLISLHIPNSVTSIQESTFKGCATLSSITIPSSITTIGAYAFDSCTKLSYISIPESVTSIGARAFQQCTSLNSITIPKSVTTINVRAFYGWKSSQTINCKHSSKPIGWNTDWNGGSAVVNWGQ